MHELTGHPFKVDRELNWKTGVWYLNIFYRRTRRFDVPLIDSILLLEDGASPPSSVDLSKYKQASGDFRSGVWPRKKALRLWYKTREPERPGASKTDLKHKIVEWDEIDDDAAVDGDGEIITELDVLYGDGRPYFGYQRVLNGPIMKANGKRWDTVDIVARRGNPGNEFSAETTYAEFY
jgi:hypothetical protein